MLVLGPKALLLGLVALGVYDAELRLANRDAEHCGQGTAQCPHETGARSTMSGHVSKRPERA